MHLSQCAAGNWMSFVDFQMYYLKFIRLDIYNNNKKSWRGIEESSFSSNYLAVAPDVVGMMLFVA